MQPVTSTCHPSSPCPYKISNTLINSSTKMFSSSPPPPRIMHSTPQWELILDLMAHLLDPKTLATASCVSKSWRSLLTSNHLWLPLCLSHYPSLTLTLTTTTSSSSSSSSSISPRSLFALLRTSSSRLRLTPCVPRISLGSLIFSIDIFQEQHTTPVLSMVRFGEDLSMNGGYRVFRFEVEVGEEERRRGVVEEEEEGEVRVVWNAVMKGWGGAFLMMDRVGRGKKRVVSSGGDEEEMWFSEELPGPACCSRAAVGAGGGGLVAELVLGLGLDAGDQGGGRRRKKVERVSLGLMSGVEWRYLSVDDALIYLQPFLLT